MNKNNVVFNLNRNEALACDVAIYHLESIRKGLEENRKEYSKDSRLYITLVDELLKEASDLLFTLISYDFNQDKKIFHRNIIIYSGDVLTTYDRLKEFADMLKDEIEDADREENHNE